MNRHSSDRSGQVSRTRRKACPEPNRRARPEQSRKEKERSDHRQTMLSAAERVFVRKGFHEATIGEIAREAEFAVGTLYNFFESKDELYAQVLDGIVREFVAEFERDVQPRDNPDDALSALIDLRMRIFDQHREFFRLFFEQSAGGVKLTKRHLAFRQQYRAAVSDIFARGIRRGIFDAMDPLYAAICLDGMLSAFARFWSTPDGGEPSSERLKKMKTTVLGRFQRRKTEALHD